MVSPWDLQRMRYFCVLAHTGLLHHRSLFQEFGPFREECRWAADYEFLLCAQRQVRAAFLDQVTTVGLPGLSMTTRARYLRENFRIHSRHSDYGRVWASWVFI